MMREPIVIETAGGEYMETVKLVEWLCAVGDEVTAGQHVATVETAKATTEVEVPHSGILLEICVETGIEVPLGSTIGYVGDPDSQKTMPTLPSSESAERRGAVFVTAKDEVGASRNRPISSPLARRIAKHNNLDLSEVRGTGPRGRIIAKDVEAAIVESPSVNPDSTFLPVQNGANLSLAESSAADGPYELVPHNRMRQVIATRLTQSKQTIPHFYLRARCNIDQLLSLRSEVNAAAPLSDESRPTFKISLNDLIVKAHAQALQEISEANVSWCEDGLQKFEHVNVGVAVAIDGGIVTPIVRHAEMKSMSRISNEIGDLVTRAHKKKLAPHEYHGGVSAVSNLGRFGVESFSAIINPPNTSILAVGAATKAGVVVEDSIEVCRVIDVDLSVDHRAIDGALAAELLATFQRNIERPILIVA